MSVLYAIDNDITTNGSKAANHLNLKKLRLKQRSTKRRYEDVPLSTHRAHAKLAAADTDEVSTKTLVFAFNRTSSKIPGSWPGDQLDFARHDKVAKEASVSAQQQGAAVKQQFFVADKGFPTDPRLATSMKHHGR